MPEVHIIDLAVPAVATEPMHLKPHDPHWRGGHFCEAPPMPNFAGNQLSASGSTPTARSAGRRPLRPNHRKSRRSRMTGRDGPRRPGRRVPVASFRPAAERRRDRRLFW